MPTEVTDGIEEAVREGIPDEVITLSARIEEESTCFSRLGSLAARSRDAAHALQGSSLDGHGYRVTSMVAAIERMHRTGIAR